MVPGSAGISICKLLLELGVGDIVLVDRNGILAVGEEWMNPAQKEMAEKTNKEQIHGDLKTAMQGRDVFVGVSAPNIVTAEMVGTMAKDAYCFCNGKSDTGDYARRSEKRRRKSCSNRKI